VAWLLDLVPDLRGHSVGQRQIVLAPGNTCAPQASTNAVKTLL